MVRSYVLLVSPYPWSAPHPAHDHVREAATVLADAGMSPVVIAPTTRAQSMLETRRTLRQLARGAELAGALGRAGLQLPLGTNAGTCPVLGVGLPLGKGSVANRLTIRQVLAATDAELVYCIDPTLPGLGRAAARLAEVPVVGAFLDATAVSSPAGARRQRAFDYVDAALAAGTGVEAALRDAGYDGPVESILPVLLVDRTRRAPDADAVVIFRSPGDDRLVRTACRTLVEEGYGKLLLANRWGRTRRPWLPRHVSTKTQTITIGSTTEADAVLARAALVVLPHDAPERLHIECGIREAATIDIDDLQVAPTPRPVSDDDRHANCAHVRESAQTVVRLAAELRAGHAAPTRVRAGTPLQEAREVLVDLHMHTNHSYDCATDPEALLWAAEQAGLDVIAVTDHNEVSGALACRELADGYDVEVIVGEEVMTDEGEVIGLFLSERIEPHMGWDETLAAIQEQDGIVYVPHPFDRMHTIPAASTLRRTLHAIDVLEVHNGRLAFEAYNHDARRFAARHNLRRGAGSDAHVLQGLGSAAVRMPAFAGPEEFLLALDRGTIIRSARSYAYVQSLKFLQTRTPFARNRRAAEQ